MSTRGKDKCHPRGENYQIMVRGGLDPSWSEWFSGLELSMSVDQEGLPITCLTGTLTDQGALRGVLNKLWDLNLTLLRLECKNMIEEVIK